MMRPDRTSVAGARYLDLQRKARQSGRPTDELIQLYALECFLERLTRSAFAKSLVLKGGYCWQLSMPVVRRETLT
jgi:hypothetical protein